MIPIGPGLELDEGELVFEFVRASGPGGQNVNKVSTAVQLRFDAARSPSLPEPLRQRLLVLAGSRATASGVLIFQARRHRTQEANRRDALERLVALLRKAAIPPKPRRATRPTLASKERRLDAKRREGEKKRTRSDPPREG